MRIPPYPHLWPYQTLGQPNQPALVFLHGFMGRGDDWLPIANALSEQFFCILPDLPGHGQNIQRSLAEPLTFETLANEFVKLLNHLELSQVGLVGYSMGGRVALHSSIRYAQRVGVLVLEGANPGMADEYARQERAAQDDEQAARLQSGGIKAFVEQWYQMPLFASLGGQPELLAVVKARRKQNDPRWAAKLISELSPGRQPPLWDKLDRLSMPVLLVAGALDEKYTALAKKMAARIPQVTIEIVPNAGHNAHLEQPDYFTRLLARYLCSIFDEGR